jgi:hypothetical protein
VRAVHCIVSTFGIFFLVSNLAVSPAHPAGSGIPDLGDNASLHGKQIFPSNNPWNQRIDAAPVDPNSAYDFSIDAQKTMLVKCDIIDKKIQRVAYLPPLDE